MSREPEIPAADLEEVTVTAQYVRDGLDKRYFISEHQFSPDWIQPGAPRTLTGTIRVEL